MPGGVKVTVSVVLRQCSRERIAALGAEAQRFGNDRRASVIARAVDAVGVGREREDPWSTVELEGEGGDVFRVAAAPAAPPSPSTTRVSPPERIATRRPEARVLLREPRVLTTQRLRLVGEIVAEIDDLVTLLVEESRRRIHRGGRRRDQVHRIARELARAGLRRLAARVAEHG